MELRQMAAFITVAEELNFGRAARRLYTGQPALSRLIRKLETELGVELLDRSTRHVELTCAGEAFLTLARTALNQVEAAARAAREAGRAEPIPLRLGTTEWTEELLPGMLKSFRRGMPACRVTVCQLDRAWQVRRLQEGAVDVALRRAPIDDPTLESEVVLDEPMLLALPADHAMAGCQSVAVMSLKETPLVLVPRHLCPAAHDRFLDVFEKAGFQPEVAQEAESLNSVPVLVAAGMGASLVPASAVGRLSESDIVYRPLEDAWPTLPLIAIWRRGDPSEAVRAFVAAARELGTSAEATVTGGRP